MGKFGYTVKNMFKSKEQREIEARMEFNKNKRSFMKYYQELDVSIRNFTKMARDAELAGNHANAQSCARFVLKLQRTQSKVQGLLQRFEMMYSMQRLTGVMSNFMQACTNMGFNMDTSIDLKRMYKDSAEMDKALGKLDAMTDQMDMVFDTIDSGMSSTGEALPSDEDNETEADDLLDKIMGRHNVTSYGPEAVAAQAEPAADGARATPAADDDIEQRLHRMMEELKD